MNIAYVIATFLFTNICRRLGWALSRNVMYGCSNVVAWNFACLWGIGVALVMRELEIHLEPHWALLWFFGYAQGGYAAIPNFGLLAESSIPPEAWPRHRFLTNYPLTFYAIGTIMFGLWLK